MPCLRSSAVVLLVALAGCASGSSAKKVESITASLKASSPGNGLLIVYRNVGGYMGGAAMFNVSLSLDGKIVGDIAHDNYVVLEVHPGELMLQARGVAGTESNIPVRVSAGSTSYAQVDMTFGNTPQLKVRESNAAQREIAEDCHLGYQRNMSGDAPATKTGTTL